MNGMKRTGIQAHFRFLTGNILMSSNPENAVSLHPAPKVQSDLSTQKTWRFS